MKAGLSVLLAALFLMLTATVVGGRSRATGFIVQIARKHPYRCAGDFKLTVVEVVDDVWLRLYDSGPTNIRIHEIKPHLRRIFSTRSDRVLYVKGNEDLPFERIARVIDVASTESDYVALLTPAVQQRAGACGYWINPEPPHSPNRAVPLHPR